MALPPVICVNERAHVCKAEPMQKTAATSQVRVSILAASQVRSSYEPYTVRTTRERDRRPS